VQHLAQNGGRIVQREVSLAALSRLGIKGRLAQMIIHQHQTAVGHSKFCETDRLRSEVKSDQARWSGHGVKGLNRNLKMPKQNFYSEMQPVESVVRNALLRPARLRLISCGFGERNTSSSTRSLFVNCRRICRTTSANHLPSS
jgi:hypothetical protein